MDYDVIIALAALLVAIGTIYFSNKNNRQQIKTGKLEELFQCIQSVSSHYGIFMDLWFKLEQLRDPDNKEINSLDDYYKERDNKLPVDKRNVINELLTRIEVLAECYTNGRLKQSTIRYSNMLAIFFYLVSNGGSTQQEINWKDGFPSFNDFYEMTRGLKADIAAAIKS